MRWRRRRARRPRAASSTARRRSSSARSPASDSLEARLAAADVALKRGQPASAAAALRRAAQLAPDDPRPRALPGRGLSRDAPPRRRAHELYALLSQAHRLFARTREFAELSPEAGRLVEVLDRPLLVTVMGEFNSGKSTFVNALIGEEVAPMGITPTTATINVLKYGAERKGRVVYHDDDVREVAWADVPKLLKGLDAAEAKRIRVVEVLYPLETLQRVNVVDTPGLNSIHPEHEETARKFIAEADAVLWLFTVDQAAKATEGEALGKIKAAGKKILGVINKIDRCSPEELERIIDARARGARRAPRDHRAVRRAAGAASAQGGDARRGAAGGVELSGAGQPRSRSASSRARAPSSAKPRRRACASSWRRRAPSAHARLDASATRAHRDGRGQRARRAAGVRARLHRRRAASPQRGRRRRLRRLRARGARLRAPASLALRLQRSGARRSRLPHPAPRRAPRRAARRQPRARRGRSRKARSPRRVARGRARRAASTPSARFSPSRCSAASAPSRAATCAAAASTTSSRACCPSSSSPKPRSSARSSATRRGATTSPRPSCARRCVAGPSASTAAFSSRLQRLRTAVELDRLEIEERLIAPVEQLAIALDSLS